MTAAKLNVSTNQEAFNAVCVHLFAMTERAIASSGFCMYRTPEGNRCAIGALISDSEAEIASITPFTGGEVGALVGSGLLNVGRVELSLLRDLQQVHDESQYWNHTEGYVEDVTIHARLSAQGRERLAEIAEKYNLIGVQP